MMACAVSSLLLQAHKWSKQKQNLQVGQRNLQSLATLQRRLTTLLDSAPNGKPATINFLHYSTCQIEKKQPKKY